MPVYVYETSDAGPARQFEIKQSMSDPALSSDPETGRPVRRVISGGYGVLQKAGAQPAPASPSGGCGSGCGCH